MSMQSSQVQRRVEVKSPRSPLLLDKSQVKAAPDFSNGVNIENLSTFWTPIGLVIVPVASTCSTG